MQVHGIKCDNGRCICSVGDEKVETSSLSECLSKLSDGLSEIKSDLWSNWQKISELAERIYGDKSGNDGSIHNLFFLNSVKKIYLLSKSFTDLSNIHPILYRLFNIDVADVAPELISQFNTLYLKIKLEHILILGEIYKVKLVKKYMQITKTAQSVSGPWANLDLPMKERVWEWEGEDEEYFAERTKSKQGQIRYNPEYNKMGYYFVWVDQNRDPYTFESNDSPYQSRNILRIP